jgi:hypothetical protein
MLNLHHQCVSKGTVKAHATIKLKCVLGPEILVALFDPKTIEIMLNSHGKNDYPLYLTLLWLSTRLA